MRSSRVRRAVFVVIVNAAVTVGLLAVIELVCRWVEQRHLDAKLPELARMLPSRAPGELRVFTFGGSSVFGMPVPELGFVAQMQYWLQRLYPDRLIRMVNYGRPGQDTAYVLSQVRRRLADQPDLVIVITGHNEFLRSPPRGRAGRVLEFLLEHAASVRLLQWGNDRLMRGRTDIVMPCQVMAWDRDAPYFDRRLRVFEQNLQLVVQAVTERHIPLIIGTLPSNVCDWPPVYKRLEGRDGRYRETVSRIQQLLGESRYAEASEALDTGLTAYPHDAMLYFLRGRMQAATGAYAEARESFVLARDLDPMPYRATSQINSIVRRVALGSGAPGVHLIDLERMYEERAPNGMVGFELIADNCHGTPLGESISAQALLQAMSDIGVLPPRGAASDVCCAVDAFLANVGYLDPHSPLHLRTALENARYVMKTPFLNADASRMYLREAMTVDENSWKVWANLGTLSYLSGDDATAAAELQRARELHPEPFDLDDREATPYLKEALEFSAGRAPCSAPY